MRERLQGRDRELFEALSPALIATTPDTAAYVEAVCALADRHRQDAELQQSCGAAMRTVDPAKAVRYAARAVAIDPKYADAWQVLGDAERARGDDPLEAYETCVEVSPIATDCFEQLAVLHAFRGACAKCEAAGRTVNGLSPEGKELHAAKAASHGLGTRQLRWHVRDTGVPVAADTTLRF